MIQAHAVELGARSHEDALLAGLRRGDSIAFEQLVRTEGGRMLAVARRILRNDDDAKDAVQDAFVAAFRSIDGFGAGSRISTWLHRIVVNAALMKIRGRKRCPEDPIEPLLPTFDNDGHRVGCETRSWLPSADDEVARRERGELVRRCIDELPASYRTVLLLRDIEDLDTSETAKLLGITENAVKIRLHRARQALRTLLEPHM